MNASSSTRASRFAPLASRGSGGGARRIALALLILSLAASGAWAHPGHELLEHGASHVFASGYHLLVITALAFVLMGLAALARSPGVRRALRVAAGLCVTAGAAWILCG